MRQKPRTNIQDKCVKLTPIGREANSIDLQYSGTRFLLYTHDLSCGEIYSVAASCFTPSKPHRGYIRHNATSVS